MKFEKTKIYGVRGVGNSEYSGINLLRTDDAVGLRVLIGNNEERGVDSDFSKCYPWCDMEEVRDTHGNVFIKIPKFYAKITQTTIYDDEAQSDIFEYQYQISGCRYEGFSTLFIDGNGNEIDYVLVGKYEGSLNVTDTETLMSVPYQPVYTTSTVNYFQSAAMRHGTGYQTYDFLIDNILKLLFTVEFACTNTSHLFTGSFTDMSGSQTTGASAGNTTDVIGPSGPYKSYTSTAFSMYRGIENLWGNSWTWCAGIQFVNRKIYICTDPASYNNSIIGEASKWHYVGNRMSVSFDGPVDGVRIKPLAKVPLLQFSYGDYQDGAGYDILYYYSPSFYAGNSGHWLLCGGANSSDAGIWTWWDDVEVATRHYDEYGGMALGSGRLCYKPISA